MKDASVKPATDNPRDTSASVPAFFIWVLLQVLALVLAWADIHLTAQGTPGSQWLALKILLVAELAGAALLFPTMLVGWQAAVLAAAISFPLTQIAAQFAGASAMAGLKASLLVAVWIAGLTAWNAVAGHRRLLLQSLIMLWVFGSAFFVYLIMEFHPLPALSEFALDISPLLMAGEFPYATRLPGLLLMNMVLSLAALSAIQVRAGKARSNRFDKAT